jgi:hypothetical protein
LRGARRFRNLRYSRLGSLRYGFDYEICGLRGLLVLGAIHPAIETPTVSSAVICKQVYAAPMELEDCLRLILQIYRAYGAQGTGAPCHCRIMFCFLSKGRSLCRAAEELPLGLAGGRACGEGRIEGFPAPYCPPCSTAWLRHGKKWHPHCYD